MQRKIQVHIADDHKILIEGIVAVINTEEDIEIEEGFDEDDEEKIIIDLNIPIWSIYELRKPLAI